MELSAVNQYPGVGAGGRPSSVRAGVFAGVQDAPRSSAWIAFFSSGSVKRLPDGGFAAGMCPDADGRWESQE
jgi:hypothetical protein